MPTARSTGAEAGDGGVAGQDTGVNRQRAGIEDGAAEARAAAAAVGASDCCPGSRGVAAGKAAKAGEGLGVAGDLRAVAAATTAERPSAAVLAVGAAAAAAAEDVARLAGLALIRPTTGAADFLLRQIVGLETADIGNRRVHAAVAPLPRCSSGSRTDVHDAEVQDGPAEAGSRHRRHRRR